jgi:hypothetical protein
VTKELLLDLDRIVTENKTREEEIVIGTECEDESGLTDSITVPLMYVSLFCFFFLPPSYGV